jgi:hypothetical protein
MNDEYVENITMPDGSVWLQLGEINKYTVGNPPSKYDPFPNEDTRKEVRMDRRIFIKLDEIVSVGAGRENDEEVLSAAIVLRGGETIHVVTNITETMEIIQEATKKPRVEYENDKHIVTRKEQK